MSMPRPGGGLATQYAPPLELPFRYLATALGWLALLALTYPWHVPMLLGSFYAPHFTTWVHVNTLGVVAATIFGASFQLLPVVLQQPLAHIRLARLSWWLYLPGLVAFVIGLSQGLLVVLAVGGTLLAAAVLAYLVVVVTTLLQPTHRDVVFWHIALAVPALATAATLGLLLALSKQNAFLGERTLPILASHATLMIGAWVTPMLTGVAYRLIGMFTLSEDRLKPAWAWTELAGTSGGAWLLAAALFFGWPRSMAALGAGLVGLGLVVFAAQALRLFRLRRRRAFDIHIPFTVTALTYSLAAAGLLLFGLMTGREIADPLWIVVGWWAVAGWVQTAIQGFLFKIGTFLVWLHRYAPLVGLQKVPRLEDLYSKWLAVAGWIGWTLGVLLAGIAALLTLEPLALGASLLLSLGAAAFLVNAASIGRHWLAAPRSARRPTPRPDAAATVSS